VKARAPGALDVTPGADPDEGAVAEVGPDAAVGAGDADGPVGEPAGGELPVPGEVTGAPFAGAVVVVVAGVTVTTKKPLTLLPVTCPGEESLTKV
jgi:hypothetical protein